MICPNNSATRAVLILFAACAAGLVGLTGVAVAETGQGYSPLFTLETREFTAVGDAPTAFHLAPAYPNPFNPSTTIAYDLPQAAAVHLTVYDLRGRIVRSLRGGVNEAAGSHQAIWNGCDDQGHPVAGGVYMYRLRAGDFNALKSMALVK